jgi:hypothetical protein
VSSVSALGVSRRFWGAARACVWTLAGALRLEAACWLRSFWLRCNSDKSLARYLPCSPAATA